ncbi:MAG TPA: hypothetical protein VGV13_13245 [Methylomirabilota bacterium]|nr:hypothetical protein [Methylomirabilota bacterium]
MPRIRSLKPEHRQHRKVGQLSHFEYRLWIGMLLEADDEGRLVADDDQLRAVVFGFHQVRPADVEIALLRIAKKGLVRLYRVRGTRFAFFPSWLDHQRIDRPQPSKLPPPPALTIHERSSKKRRTITERSTNARHRSDLDLIGSDQRGSEGIGGEGSVRGGEPAVVDNPVEARSDRASIRSALALDSEEPGHQRTAGEVGTDGQEPQRRGLTAEEDQARLEALTAELAREKAAPTVGRRTR